MAAWAIVGKGAVWLLLWVVAMTLIRGVAVAVGEQAAAHLFRTVVEMGIGLGLYCLLFIVRWSR